MSELQSWLKVLLYTQLALAASLLGGALTAHSWIPRALNLLGIVAVALTAKLAAKRYREIR